MRSIVFQLLLLLSLSSAGVSAQTEPVPAPKPAAVNDQNIDKPIETPPAVFPESGRRDNISGLVMVRMLVDETGKVISAEVVSGLEQKDFRDSAIAAAMKARFHPRIKDGVPIKVYRRVQYNFAFEDDNNLEKIKLFGMGTVIEILKAFAEHPDLFAKSFGGMNGFSDIKDDPIYGKHFTGLARYSDLTPEKRRVEAENAYVSLKKVLVAKEQWELEAGKSFGSFVGPILLLQTQNAGLEKLVQAFENAKVTLAPLIELLKQSPKDIDPILIARLKALTDSATSDKSSNERILSVLKTIDDLFSAF